MTRFECTACGAGYAKWEGRCSRCGEWNSLESPPPGYVADPRAKRRTGGVAPVTALVEIDAGRAMPVPTGLAEVDRVLGGGLVPSSVTLIAGEPGVGKSTLLLQMLGSLARQGAKCLLVSAEEPPDQVRRRAERLGAAIPGLWITAAADLEAIAGAVQSLSPAVVVMDSIQTVTDPTTTSPAGSVASVRAATLALSELARAEGGPALVLVGHVTKDGSIAGPRALEHLVDTVLAFEGDRRSPLRALRAVKHRFGAVGEVGVWRMTATGLEEVPDPASELLADRRPGAPGSVVLATMDGHRPLLVEVQALVVAAAGASRRSAEGYDAGRLTQLLAVLDRRAGLSLAGHDVYVSAAGGLRLAEPAADLAVAAAVASAFTGFVVDPDAVVYGEVGLGGELRRAGHDDRRLAEAARHGFRCAVRPGEPTRLGELQVRGAATVSEALDVVLGAPASEVRLRVVAGR